MDRKLFGLGVFLVVVAIVVWIAYRNIRHDKALISELKQKYDAALSKSDRQIALKAGREYYARLNGGTVAAHDELAIQNDLLSMK